MLTKFFQIKDEMVLLTKSPGRVMSDFFSTFGTTEFVLRQSIVPIVAWQNGDTEIRCIGTGFFISASGLLLTAAHVLRDPVDERYANFEKVSENGFRLENAFRFGVLIPINPAMRSAPPDIFNVPKDLRSAKWIMAPFEWAVHWGKNIKSPLLHEHDKFELSLDVAVCKVKQSPLGAYQPLNIGLHSLKPRDQAIVIGYPEMNNIRIDRFDEYQPELSVSVGTVTNIYNDNVSTRETPTPGLARPHEVIRSLC